MNHFPAECLYKTGAPDKEGGDAGGGRFTGTPNDGRRPGSI